jgi:hypothetical protein
VQSNAVQFNSWYCRGYDIWQDGQQPTHGFKILFDTGCHGSNWISPNIFEKLEAKATDHGQEYCFQDFNGNSFSAKRTTRLNFQRAGVPEAKVYSADFFIADRDTHFQIMLGADDLRNFNLLAQPVYPLIPAVPSSTSRTTIVSFKHHIANIFRRETRTTESQKSGEKQGGREA